MKQLILISLISICAPFKCFGGSFGGYITWDHLGGFNYNIQVVVFVDSFVQNYDSIQVRVDGASEQFYLDSTHSLNCTNFTSSAVKHIHYYSKPHAFPGHGVFKIDAEISNLNQGIENVLGSVNIPLSLSATLVLDPFVGASNEGARPLNIPIFTSPVIDTFAYNPVYMDSDGDSLHYELVRPRGAFGQTMGSVTYVFPDDPIGGSPTGGGGLMTIDPLTGHLCWTDHLIPGEFLYNVRVREFRQGVHVGTYEFNSLIVLVDTTNVIPNTHWDPQLPFDVWRVNYMVVNPGDTIDQILHFNDGGGNNYALEWFDDIQAQGATVTSSGAGSDQQINLYWETDALDVRTEPYTFIVKSTNDDLGFPCESYQHDVTLRIYIGSIPTVVSEYSSDPIMVYPNPTHDELNISLPNATGECHVNIFNGMGQLVTSENLRTTETQLSLAGNPPGLYVVRVVHDGRIVSKKLIKH